MMRLRPLILTIVSAVMLTSCGPAPAASPQPSGSTATLPPASASAPSPAPAAGKRGPSKGELRVAENTFPTALDSDVGFAGYSLMSYGIAEALMKVTPQMKVEPQIAAKLDQLDALTWKVTLRDDVTFWDGSKVDAAAVKASLERSMEKQPGTTDLLPKGSVLTADGLTLTIKTPTPVALMANSLASYNFGIKKVVGDNVLYTGPFMYADYVQGQSITLNAYEGYRGGPARLKTIKVRNIPDVNTRVLALQSGDVDIAHALLPSDVTKLKNAGLQAFAFPFGRQDDIILNVTRAPLDDVQVRRAVALAVDREALLKGVMDGVGTVAYGLAPEDLGLPGVTRTQKSDLAEARRVLDAASWVPAADGIRMKNGKRLSFSLGSYASRAELEPLSIAIKDQLKAAGIEVTLTKYPDINTTVAKSEFDATMYSYGVAPFGDLNRALATLYTPAGTNKDRYNNPKVNDLFKVSVQGVG